MQDINHPIYKSEVLDRVYQEMKHAPASQRKEALETFLNVLRHQNEHRSRALKKFGLGVKDPDFRDYVPTPQEIENRKQIQESLRRILEGKIKREKASNRYYRKKYGD
jgi:hypothetical protein